MGFSEPLNNIASGIDRGAAFYTTIGNTAATTDPAKEPVSFDSVFRDTLGDSAAADTPVNSFGTESIAFSAGSEVQKMRTMSQMRDLFFSEELNMFDDDNDLDDSIGFDEIEELDQLTDSRMPVSADITAGATLSDETAGFLDSVLVGDDMLAFSDIEDEI